MRARAGRCSSTVWTARSCLTHPAVALPSVVIQRRAGTAASSVLHATQPLASPATDVFPLDWLVLLAQQQLRGAATGADNDESMTNTLTRVRQLAASAASTSDILTADALIAALETLARVAGATANAELGTALLFESSARGLLSRNLVDGALIALVRSGGARRAATLLQSHPTAAALSSAAVHVDIIEALMGGGEAVDADVRLAFSVAADLARSAHVATIIGAPGGILARALGAATESPSPYAALHDLVAGDGGIAGPGNGAVTPMRSSEYARLYHVLLEPAFRRAGGVAAAHAAVVGVLRSLSAAGSTVPAASARNGDDALIADFILTVCAAASSPSSSSVAEATVCQRGIVAAQAAPSTEHVAGQQTSSVPWAGSDAAVINGAPTARGGSIDGGGTATPPLDPLHFGVALVDHLKSERLKLPPHGLALIVAAQVATGRAFGASVALRLMLSAPWAAGDPTVAARGVDVALSPVVRVHYDGVAMRAYAVWVHAHGHAGWASALVDEAAAWAKAAAAALSTLELTAPTEAAGPRDDAAARVSPALVLSQPAVVEALCACLRSCNGMADTVASRIASHPASPLPVAAHLIVPPSDVVLAGGVRLTDVIARQQWKQLQQQQQSRLEAGKGRVGDAIEVPRSQLAAIEARGTAHLLSMLATIARVPGQRTLIAAIAVDAHPRASSSTDTVTAIKTQERSVNAVGFPLAHVYDAALHVAVRSGSVAALVSATRDLAVSGGRCSPAALRDMCVAREHSVRSAARAATRGTGGGAATAPKEVTESVRGGAGDTLPVVTEEVHEAKRIFAADAAPDVIFAAGHRHVCHDPTTWDALVRPPVIALAEGQWATLLSSVRRMTLTPDAAAGHAVSLRCLRRGGAGVSGGGHAAEPAQVARPSPGHVFSWTVLQQQVPMHPAHAVPGMRSEDSDNGATGCSTARATTEALRESLRILQARLERRVTFSARQHTTHETNGQCDDFDNDGWVAPELSMPLQLRVLEAEAAPQSGAQRRLSTDAAKATSTSHRTGDDVFGDAGKGDANPEECIDVEPADQEGDAEASIGRASSSLGADAVVPDAAAAHATAKLFLKSGVPFNEARTTLSAAYGAHIEAAGSGAGGARELRYAFSAFEALQVALEALVIEYAAAAAAAQRGGAGHAKRTTTAPSPHDELAAVPDAHYFGQLVRACARAGQPRRAARVLRYATECGRSPGAPAYAAAIRAAAGSAAAEQGSASAAAAAAAASALLDEAEKALPAGAVQHDAYVAVATAYATARRARDALATVRRAQRAGHIVGVDDSAWAGIWNVSGLPLPLVTVVVLDGLATLRRAVRAGTLPPPPSLRFYHSPVARTHLRGLLASTSPPLPSSTWGLSHAARHLVVEREAVVAWLTTPADGDEDDGARAGAPRLKRSGSSFARSEPADAVSMRAAYFERCLVPKVISTTTPQLNAGANSAAKSAAADATTLHDPEFDSWYSGWVRQRMDATGAARAALKDRALRDEMARYDARRAARTESRAAAKADAAAPTYSQVTAAGGRITDFASAFELEGDVGARP